jgi:hypothetical protein
VTQQTLIDPPKRGVTPTPGLTARHMTDLLRRHYLPENRPVAGVFAPEIGSPCGKRRADLIWMPATIAGGRGLYGHEIKVSRADLLTELADPTKADPWAQYCSRWWLVIAHPALIKGLDIPAPWGVMAPPSGRRTRSMTILKPAPALNPKEPGPGIARLAAWQLYGTAERVATLERRVQDLTRDRDYLQSRVTELLGSGARSDHPEGKRVARILALLDQRLATEHMWDKPADEGIVVAILDHTATAAAARHVRMQLQELVSSVQRMTEPFRWALKDLETAERLAAELAKPEATP